MNKLMQQVLLAALLLLGVSWSGSAQQTATTGSIVGTVVDASTHEALPFVQVFITGTTLGTTTDANGAFSLTKLKPGTYSLQARLVGYASEQVRLSVTAGHSRHLDLYLKAQSIDLDGVVVSANRHETMRRNAPSLVTVLSQEVFTKTNSENLSQGLRFQPGLRIEDNCQNCGFNQVRINGLEGAYSQILIDSRPVFSALAGVYGLEQIPASMIERVEVIRGGGSALFGANAVGGVINVITREPLRSTATLKQSITSYEQSGHRYTAPMPVTSYNASLVSEDRRAAVMVFGQHARRGFVDVDGDQFTDIPELKQRALGLRAYYKTGIYSKLTAEWRSMHEYRRGGDRLDEAPFQARIAEYLQHFINGASLRFDQNTAEGKDSFSLYGSGQQVLRKSYYGGGDYAEQLLKPLRELPRGAQGSAEESAYQEAYDAAFKALTSYGQTKGFDFQAGGTYIHHFDRPWTLTAGAEVSYSLLNDKSGYRAQGIDQKTWTWSQYDQLEYSLDRWSFLLGGRLDYVHLTQGGKKSIDPLLILSPRANVRFAPTKDLGLRLSYSEGFRAPQFFDEEMHVTLAGGEPKERVLGKDLREERSRSLSASADWYTAFGSWQLNLMGEGFATFIKNKFTADNEDGVLDPKTGKKVITIINAAGSPSQVYGINLEGRLAYRRLLDLQAGLTLQRSRYGAEKTLFEPSDETPTQATITTRDYERTPNVYGYFAATLRPSRPLSFTLSGTYTGSMKVPHETYEGFDGIASAAKPDSRGAFDYTDAAGTQYRGLAPGFAQLTTTKPFLDLDLRVSYALDLTSLVKLTLDAGIQNFLNSYQQDTDKGPGRASAYIYGPTRPRRLYLSATFDL
ncbi:TonB-dependent receptor [Porphyromonas sp.]